MTLGSAWQGISQALPSWSSTPPRSAGCPNPGTVSGISLGFGGLGALGLSCVCSDRGSGSVRTRSGLAGPGAAVISL